METVNRLIPLFFLGYFAILFVERIQSLVRMLGDSEYSIIGSRFDIYVNFTLMLSLLATVVMLAAFNGDFWKSIFVGGTPNYGMLTVTAGVILISGMVHTEYTVPPLQFAAYGFLIVAMILQTVIAVQNGGNAFRLWYSLAYLTVFSMAIPVMYHSNIEKAALFHILEAVISVVLVICFTLMLRQMFVSDGSNLLYIIPIVIAVIGDAVLIYMRWAEEPNFFVLIFASLAAFMFVLGKILFAVVK